MFKKDTFAADKITVMGQLRSKAQELFKDVGANLAKFDYQNYKSTIRLPIQRLAVEATLGAEIVTNKKNEPDFKTKGHPADAEQTGLIDSIIHRLIMDETEFGLGTGKVPTADVKPEMQVENENGEPMQPETYGQIVIDNPNEATYKTLKNVVSSTAKGKNALGVFLDYDTLMSLLTAMRSARTHHDKQVRMWRLIGLGATVAVVGGAGTAYYLHQKKVHQDELEAIDIEETEVETTDVDDEVPTVELPAENVTVPKLPKMVNVAALPAPAKLPATPKLPKMAASMKMPEPPKMAKVSA